MYLRESTPVIFGFEQLPIVVSMVEDVETGELEQFKYYLVTHENQQVTEFAGKVMLEVRTVKLIGAFGDPKTEVEVLEAVNE